MACDRERIDMIIVGIDPGISGAVAFIKLPSGVVEIYDTTVAEIKKGKTKKNEYLPYQMAKLLNFCRVGEFFLFIEKVHSMPGQGVASMFNFGRGFGLWEGIAAGLGLPINYVTPQAWKKEVMTFAGDKDQARIRAQELFPECSSLLSRKRDIGRADALLIAEYGRRVMKGR